MATYVVGDIHGCFDEFQRLLDKLDFGDGDRLLHTGDMVNGGPDSLATVRWFAEHDDVATTVLGNHDLHLLAVATGCRKPRSKDQFDDVLQAPDRDELVDWIRRQPLLVEMGQRVLVHAGLLPHWTVEEAREAARDIEELLSSPKPEQLLSAMYGNTPRSLGDAESLEERWRVIVNALTRMRVLRDNGDLDFSFKSTYGEIPEGKTAWFDVDEPAWEGHQIICGHWSALGLYRSERVIALDSGCRWGGALTAFRLDDDQVIQVDANREPVFD